MSERYKVLGAMLALQDFTVPDLVQYSGVRPETVRTVVTRERHKLKPLGKEDRSGRGGRFKRFQVHPTQLEAIREELNDLYRALPQEPHPLPSESSAPESVPLPILAAEDTLIRRFPQAAEQEGKRLLNLAESVWRRYCSILPENLPNATRLHLESLDGLRKLCSAELATAYEPFFSRVAFDRAKESLRLVAAAFKQAGQSEHATELLDRALRSTIASAPADLVRSKTSKVPKALEHSDVYVREVAVQAVAASANVGSTSPQLRSDVVARLQHDDDPVVRRTAAEVLGELKVRDTAVEQALTKAAQDDEPSVQSAARKSLAALEAHPAKESVEVVARQRMLQRA